MTVMARAKLRLITAGSGGERSLVTSKVKAKLKSTNTEKARI